MVADFPVWWGFCMRPENDGSADDTDPTDGAGQTRWGWTLPTWEDATRYTGHKPALSDFLAMNLIGSAELAEAYFWDRLGGQAMPGGVDMSVIDWAWNSGPSIIRSIQNKLGVATDGVIGPATCRAMVSYGPAKLVRDICTWRVAFLDARGFRKTEPGLYTRATGCRDLALVLAPKGT